VVDFVTVSVFDFGPISAIIATLTTQQEHSMYTAKQILAIQEIVREHLGRDATETELMQFWAEHFVMFCEHNEADRTFEQYVQGVDIVSEAAEYLQLIIEPVLALTTEAVFFA
jgi:hypothetical protein